jgi:hypothetical protein
VAFQKGEAFVDIQNPKTCGKCDAVLESGFLAGGGFGLAFYPDVHDASLLQSLRMMGKFFSGRCISKFIGTGAVCCPSCRVITFRY